MKSSKLIFLTFVSLLVIGGQNQVRYFLSELDFLANRDVPKSEVIRKQHIRAEYDPMNRLVRKTFVDRSGRSLRSESYSYIDTNTVARQKELIDSEGKLFFKTVFGRESESVSYIEWVFGVDSVKKWDDRFTTSSLNDQNQPNDYRFFDVDNTGSTADDDGSIASLQKSFGGGVKASLEYHVASVGSNEDVENFFMGYKIGF